MSRSVVAPSLKFYGWWYWKQDKTGSCNDATPIAAGPVLSRWTATAIWRGDTTPSQTPKGLDTTNAGRLGDGQPEQCRRGGLAAKLTPIPAGTFRQTYETVLSAENARKSGPGLFERALGTAANVMAAVAVAGVQPSTPMERSPTRLMKIARRTGNSVRTFLGSPADSPL